MTLMNERFEKVPSAKEALQVSSGEHSPSPESDVHEHDSPNHKPLLAATPQEAAHPKVESGLEHFKNCPNCHKEILAEARKELEPEILKAQREKLKTIEKPVICQGCGEIVGEKESSCPNCKGTKARRI